MKTRKYYPVGRNFVDTNMQKDFFIGGIKASTSEEFNIIVKNLSRSIEHINIFFKKLKNCFIAEKLTAEDIMCFLRKKTNDNGLTFLQIIVCNSNRRTKISIQSQFYAIYYAIKNHLIDNGIISAKNFLQLVFFRNKWNKSAYSMTFELSNKREQSIFFSLLSFKVCFFNKQHEFSKWIARNLLFISPYISNASTLSKRRLMISYSTVIAGMDQWQRIQVREVLRINKNFFQQPLSLKTVYDKFLVSLEFHLKNPTLEDIMNKSLFTKISQVPYGKSFFILFSPVGTIKENLVDDKTYSSPKQGCL
jgi:hypothetical protein